MGKIEAACDNFGFIPFSDLILFILLPALIQVRNLFLVPIEKLIYVIFVSIRE